MWAALKSIYGGQGQVANHMVPTASPPTPCSQYHQRVYSQGQQLQQLQTELNKLHKEVSSVRAAHSEVCPCVGLGGGCRYSLCVHSRLHFGTTTAWVLRRIFAPDTHSGDSFSRPLRSYL